jgi:hypothetical protein
LYSSPSIIILIKWVEWTGDAARMGEKRNAYRILMGMQEGKRPLGTPRRSWVKSIKMNGMVWIGLMCLMTETSGGLL